MLAVFFLHTRNLSNPFLINVPDVDHYVSPWCVYFLINIPDVAHCVALAAKLKKGSPLSIMGFALLHYKQYQLFHTFNIGKICSA